MAPVVALPPLPPLDAPADELEASHRGPTFRCNWLVPGHVLAGDRASLDEDASLRAVLAAGVSTIVCLQTRQETKVAVDYRRRKELIQRNTSFHECPIVDQQVAEDGLVEALVGELAERVQRGEVLYVHCRGGHGRTGTVCALLLGRLYDLSAPEALARVQLCHDTRVQPCFSARFDGRARLLAGDGGACVSLFPVQQAQVVRLLPPPRDDGLSRWRAAGEEAAAALQQAKAGPEEERHGELLRAAAAFREARALRPDFVKGHIGLARALRLAGEAAEARQVLQDARGRWPDDAGVLDELRRLPAAGAAMGHAPEAVGSLEGAVCLGSSPEPAAKRAADAPKAAGREPASRPPGELHAAVGGAEEAFRDHGVAGAVAAARQAESSALGADGPAPSARPAAEQPEGSSAPPLPPAAAAVRPQDRRPSSPEEGRRPLAAAPHFVMLVGLPGSGKSTFGGQLAASAPCWDRVCQDELGGRAAVESALGPAARDPARRVILDRCNVDPADRRYLLELAFRPEGAVCVFFAAPPEVCEARVAARTSHPTIGFGGGRRAVQSMHKGLREPRTDEGFQEVVTVRDFAEADQLLRRWGAEPPEVRPPGLFPFPDVPRLAPGGGSEGRGGCLLAAAASARLLGGAVVTVEEIAGGAVCGISLTPEYELQLQSGGRYLDLADTDAAAAGGGGWGGLAEWLRDNEGPLLSLLEPEAEVLFGEWCRAPLLGPDARADFLAWDIYDKRRARFCSARARDERLAPAGLRAAPRLAERPLAGEELPELLRRPSALRPGAGCRGLQLRLDEPGGLWLELRAQAGAEVTLP